jgi:hypothetical protein
LAHSYRSKLGNWGFGSKASLLQGIWLIAIEARFDPGDSVRKQACSRGFCLEARFDPGIGYISKLVNRLFTGRVWCGNKALTLKPELKEITLDFKPLTRKPQTLNLTS